MPENQAYLETYLQLTDGPIPTHDPSPFRGSLSERRAGWGRNSRTTEFSDDDRARVFLPSLTGTPAVRCSRLRSNRGGGGGGGGSRTSRGRARRPHLRCLPPPPPRRPGLAQPRRPPPPRTAAPVRGGGALDSSTAAAAPPPCKSLCVAPSHLAQDMLLYRQHRI